MVMKSPADALQAALDTTTTRMNMDPAISEAVENLVARLRRLPPATGHELLTLVWQMLAAAQWLAQHENTDPDPKKMESMQEALRLSTEWARDYIRTKGLN